MIEVMTKDRIEKGIRRLLTAPQDLKSCGAPVWDFHGGASSAAHRHLLGEYRRELSIVIPAALDWWAETLTARQRYASDPDEALRQAWIVRPAGPASYSGFVALIRDYWLACHRLNLKALEAERVPPEVFLLASLLDGGYTDAVKVIACMPYWPIGMDQNGNWV